MRRATAASPPPPKHMRASFGYAYMVSAIARRLSTMPMASIATPALKTALLSVTTAGHVVGLHEGYCDIEAEAEAVAEPVAEAVALAEIVEGNVCEGEGGAELEAVEESAIEAEGEKEPNTVMEGVNVSVGDAEVETVVDVVEELETVPQDDAEEDVV